MVKTQGLLSRQVDARRVKIEILKATTKQVLSRMITAPIYMKEYLFNNNASMTCVASSFLQVLTAAKQLMQKAPTKTLS